MGGLIPPLSGAAPGVHSCTAALALHVLAPYGCGCLPLWGEWRTWLYCKSSPCCSTSCLFLAVSIQMRSVFAQFKESLIFPGDKHLNHSRTRQTPSAGVACSQGLAPLGHPKPELGISFRKSGQYPALMS